MEAIAAFGLACNVLQVAETSLKVAKIFREAYKHDSVKQHEDAIRLSDNLSSAVGELRSSMRQPLSKDDAELNDIAQQCLDKAAKLYNMCTPNSASASSSRRRNRLKRGFKAVQLSLNSDIKNLEADIQTLRKDLDTRVLVSLRSRYDLASARQGTAFATLRNDIQNFIHQQTQLQHQQHQQTRKTVLDGTTVISNQIRSMNVSAGDQRARDRLLSSLFFPDMNARKNQIPAAHPDTFEWLFKQDMTNTGSDTSSDENKIPYLHRGDARKISDLRNSFHDWLKSGQQVYWISGKPGSGKSTLMNFIVEHESTWDYLQEWSKSQNLVLIESYLWNAGAESQRTYRGVLATLLTQLLTRSPHLIHSFLDHNSGLGRKTTLMDWSVRELEKWLFDCLNTNDAYFCVFIDGLDEAEIDATASFNPILHFVNNAATLNNVKCCVSSRPLLQFEVAFKDSPRMRLQDLNAADIHKYFEDNATSMFNNAGMNTSGHDFRMLQYEFCVKADGVFLWACLAVGSLKRGIENSDSIHEMRQRLEILPPELEDLYRHMWEQQNKDIHLYREEASLFLNVYLDDIDRIHGDHLSSLHWLFVRPSNGNLRREALAGKISENLEQECKHIQAQILSRSAGLLEVRNNDVPLNDVGEHKISSSDFPALQAALTSRIVFTHRTAQDFLLTSAFGQGICSNSKHTTFQLERLVRRARLCVYMITSRIPDPRYLNHIVISTWKDSAPSEEDAAVLVNDIVEAFEHRVLSTQQHLDVSNWFTMYKVPCKPFALDFLGATLQIKTPWLMKDKLHHRVISWNPAYRIYLMYCWLQGLDQRDAILFASFLDILWNPVNCSEELMRHVMHMQVGNSWWGHERIVHSIRLRVTDILLHTIRIIVQTVSVRETILQLPFFENLLNLPFAYDQDVFLVGRLCKVKSGIYADWLLGANERAMPHDLLQDDLGFSRSMDTPGESADISIFLQFKVGFLLRVALWFVEIHFGVVLQPLSEELSSLYTDSAVTFLLIRPKNRPNKSAIRLDRAESDSLATMLGYDGPSGHEKFLNDLTHLQVPATSEFLQKVENIIEHGEKVDYVTCLKDLGIVKDVIDPNVEEGPPPLYLDGVNQEFSEKEYEEPSRQEQEETYAVAKDRHDAWKPKADDSRSKLSLENSSDEDQFVDAPEEFA